MKKRKFIYLCNLRFDDTIYRTQVIEWLEIYRKYGLTFNLYQVFHIKKILKIKYIINQIKGIKNNTCLFKGFLFFTPSKGFFVFLNFVGLYLYLLKYVNKNNEILIFTRGLLGKEIELLKRFFPVKVIFIFDSRGAGAEERKYEAKKQNNFSIKEFNTIAQVYYSEYRTICAADKVFVVSNALENYFYDTFNFNNKKYILYPCLADSDKFYFNIKIRNELRRSLKIDERTKVFIYSGGIEREWHLTERMLTFFLQVLKYEKDSLLIFLTKNALGLEKILNQFPDIKTHFLSFSVQNNEVNKFLNTADYGILFRENTIMNNVASPTKFAEYMLCGLPVLISEGIGDYSNFTVKYNLGVLIKKNELENPGEFNFKNFLNKTFDRNYISNIGKNKFSKVSILNNIISELKS